MGDRVEKPELVDPNADAAAAIDDYDAGERSLPYGDSDRRTGPLDLVLDELPIVRMKGFAPSRLPQEGEIAWLARQTYRLSKPKFIEQGQG